MPKNRRPGRPPNPDRLKARQKGKLTYKGTACSVCGTVLRYTSCGSCVACVKQRTRSRRKNRAGKPVPPRSVAVKGRSAFDRSVVDAILQAIEEAVSQAVGTKVKPVKPAKQPKPIKVKRKSDSQVIHEMDKALAFLDEKTGLLIEKRDSDHVTFSHTGSRPVLDCDRAPEPQAQSDGDPVLAEYVVEHDPILEGGS